MIIDNKMLAGMFRICSISLILLLCVSCAPLSNLKRGESILLASYIDSTNEVAVSIQLAHTQAGSFLLAATFTPPQGYHLYSKDIPKMGVNGQGRPTLLELLPHGEMQAAGTLIESAAAELPSYEPAGAPIYPAGPVTLSLPVQLALKSGWVEDQVSLTYMACTDTICKTPTIGRVVSVRVPGAESVNP
jgi:Disulphide bond corrector protein DsbC